MATSMVEAAAVARAWLFMVVREYLAVVVLGLGGLTVLFLAIAAAYKAFLRAADWIAHTLDIWDLVREIRVVEMRRRRGAYKSGLPEYFFIRDIKYVRSDKEV